ncbi:MAG: hypothetical protein CM15mP93_12490 [Thiotrichaceae bacterium]|nr:MAG: hypothetical protein CM15mP93_12490 [Thiotrichaceae bacterium]
MLVLIFNNFSFIKSSYASSEIILSSFTRGPDAITESLSSGTSEIYKAKVFLLFKRLKAFHLLFLIFFPEVIYLTNTVSI